jgi:exodeoxyribonuclease VIII
MNDIMLDLETWATTPDAVILSVGACFFDKELIGDSLYLCLNRAEQFEEGRKVSDSTAQWWSEQSEEARKVFNEVQVPVEQFLGIFTEWVEHYAADRKSVRMWGNGSDFDNAILGNLYDQWGIKKPWSYSNNRCYRTLRSICLPFDSHDMPQREGTYHHALHDAQYQAAMAGRYLKGTLK